MPDRETDLEAGDRDDESGSIDLFGAPVRPAAAGKSPKSVQAAGRPSSGPSGSSGDRTDSPLADRMRPLTLDDFVGQQDVLGEGGFLREAIAADRIPSIILWGPPGCGKTSLARIIAERTRAVFVPFSAVLSGVKEVRAIAAEAVERLETDGRRTILFIDEIHRFNKAQQDAFLPHVESGTVTLIGATTENPYFEVNSALLSRCRVVKLMPLSHDDVIALGRRALSDPDRGLGALPVTVPDDVLELLARASDGDGRRMLNLLEASCGHAARRGVAAVDVAIVDAVVSGPGLRYDRAYEEHYNVISAFIKSLRGSDPDAAMYYMVRMLEGGEDPRFVCRRMIIFAAEDIGNADPRALQIALAAKDALVFVGLPEAEIPMAQACTYLACAPKSNRSYLALHAAKDAVRKTGSLEVPMHIRNAPAKGMVDHGYGQGYAYPHDYDEAFVACDYLPDALAGRRFYEPRDSGYEKTIGERLAWWRSKRRP
jgi:putative ATPase